MSITTGFYGPGRVPSEAETYNIFMIVTSFLYLYDLSYMVYNSLGPYLDQHMSGITVWILLGSFVLAIGSSTYWIVIEQFATADTQLHEQMGRLRLAYALGILGDILALIAGIFIQTDLRSKMSQDETTFDVTTVKGALQAGAIAFFILFALRIIVTGGLLRFSKRFRDYFFGRATPMNLPVGGQTASTVPQATTRQAAPPSLFGASPGAVGASALPSTSAAVKA